MQNPQDWQSYAHFAEQAFELGHLEVADNLIRMALACAAAFGEYDFRYISTLEHLADVQSASGKSLEALDGYRRAYGLLQRFYGIASYDALHLQIKLGEALIVSGRNSEAESMLLDAQATCQKFDCIPAELRSVIEKHLHKISSQKQSIPSAIRLFKTEPEPAKVITQNKMVGSRNSISRNSLPNINVVALRALTSKSQANLAKIS